MKFDDLVLMAMDTHEKAVKITFHYGDSNWFKVSVPETMVVGSLYRIVQLVIPVAISDILYLICDGKILDSDCLNKKLHTFTNLMLRDYNLTSHIVLKNHNLTEIDRFDCIVQNQYSDWSRSLMRRTAAEDDISNLTRFATMLNAFTAQAMDGDQIQMSYENLGNLENVPVVLSEQEFNEITTLIETPETDVDVDPESECFCGDPLIHDDQTVTKLPCGHCFHTECIKAHLTTNNTKCPICTLDVRES